MGALSLPDVLMLQFQIHLLFFLFALLLGSDVIPDHGLIKTHRAHTVPARPEIEPYEIAFPSVALVNHDRRLPFQLADRIRHTVLRRNP